MDINEKQKTAIQHIHGPALVLAGAGSGKTRTVTCRIAHLLQMGVSPREILALTFTNKAAKEMSARIQSLQDTYVLTTTFHSLGAKILRESIHHLGYRSQFTIYDEDDSEKILKRSLEDLDIKQDKAFLKTIRAKISLAKNQLLSPEDPAFSEKQEEFPDPFVRIYTQYQKRLKEANAVDFDDLLFLSVKLLKENASVRSLYQNRWLFLLIDEYQDTNFAQYTLAKILTEKHQNLFAVGDPDQSIYSWRGALVQNILNFQEDFPGASIITLDENYRSTNRILRAANAVIAHNKSRYEKELWSAKGEGEKIGIYLGQNEKKEALFIVEKIEEICLQSHINFADVAILYRTNAQSRALEDVLLQKSFPYTIIGGLSFYQRKEIKDILAYLRLFVSPSDPVAFARTINVPKRGIGAKAVQNLLQESSQRSIPILHLVKQLAFDPPQNLSIKLSQKQRAGLQKYAESFQHLQAHWNKEESIPGIIQEVIKEFSYDAYLQEDPDTYRDRKENVEALVAKASEWQEEATSPSLHAFLEEVSLNASIDRPQESSIKLMTLHNGKGLEFSVVCIIGLEEDILPHASAKPYPSQLEEERRLFYVGMTRAKRFLFLSAAAERYLWGSSKRMTPSRFLLEIPKEYTEEYTPSFGSKTFASTSRAEKDFLFQEGDWVLHQEFGKGMVQKAYHTSYGATYDVYFTEHSIERSLVAKYAKLEPFSSFS